MHGLVDRLVYHLKGADAASTDRHTPRLFGCGLLVCWGVCFTRYG